MLSVQVAPCNRCRKVASQGTVANKPVCVSCALVGDDVETTSRPETNELVTALVGPNRTDSLAAGRGLLRASLGKDADKINAYNDYASRMVDALRAADTTSYNPLFCAAGGLRLRRVNASALASGALRLQQAVQSGSISYEEAAYALLRPVEAVLENRYRARSLIASALAPLSQAELHGWPRLLYLGDEPQQVMDLDMQRVKSALQTVGDERDEMCTLDEAVECVAAQLYSSEADDLRKRLRSTLPAARRDLAAKVGDRATPVDAESTRVDLGALEALTARLAHDPAFRMQDLDAHTAQVVDAYLSALPLQSDSTLQDLELVQSANGLPIGVDALSHVDASLLERAREKAGNLKTGKPYSLIKMRTQLLQLFGEQISKRWTDEETRDFIGRAVATSVRGQRIVETPGRQWSDFLLVAGNTFYRDPEPLPQAPAIVPTTEDQFVNRYFGKNNNFQDSAFVRELVNMASYMSRGVTRYQIRPTAFDEMVGPEGTVRVPKTPEANEVARDLQKLRRQLIQELQRVSTRTGMSRAVETVDLLLLRMFDRLWDKTVAESEKEGGRLTSFEGVYTMYMQQRGTPTERRRSLLQRFAQRVRK